MLTSISLIFLCGLLMGNLFDRLRLPALLGMIVTGVIMSPHAFDLIDESILDISTDLRQIALVIILMRAGLSLNISDLKKVGRPALLMCFVPACFEILGIVIIAPRIFGISIVDALVMGSVTAAVSPAVIVPRMIRLMDEGCGVNKSIPQMILAGASVDDVFVIVIFTAFTALASGDAVSAASFLQIPTSIVLGIAVGAVCGMVMIYFFKKIHMRDSVKILIILSISFLLLELQNRLEGIVAISGLLAIMAVGIVINKKYNILAARLSAKYNKLWVAAEIILFVLVGATVDLSYVTEAGVMAVITVCTASLFRVVGVFVCLIKTGLNKKERLFCMIAYIPKATVQAAIGAIPLSMGLSCGQLVLTVAVLSILITAPIGAIFIDKYYTKLLSK